MHLFRSARYPGSRKMTVSEPTTAQIVSIRRKTHLRYQKNDFRVSRMRFLALGYFTSLQSLLTLFHFQYRVPAASSAESGDMTGSGKKELHTDNRCAVLFFRWATRIRTLKMTESESVALPFGDSPIFCFPLRHSSTAICIIIHDLPFRQALFLLFSGFFMIFPNIDITLKVPDIRCRTLLSFRLFGSKEYGPNQNQTKHSSKFCRFGNDFLRNVLPQGSSAG